MQKNTSKTNFISESDVSITDSYFVSDDCLLIVNRKKFKKNINTFLTKQKKSGNKLNRGVFLPLSNFTY